MSARDPKCTVIDWIMVTMVTEVTEVTEVTAGG